ncbi:MAG: hypothetical protein GYB53_25350 [Rhodobacteraceae bacterium]|nr:hypothetical protein [Paracoccaceae bacterium]MBR9823010.1 hypothetical protein [Paracoccaceae bacterium]
MTIDNQRDPLGRGHWPSDLWNAGVPFLLATIMAPTSFGGAAVFLLAWFIIREALRAAGHG